MPRFRYRAIAADGQPLEGEMEARSKAAVVARLQAAGHLPIDAEEAAGRGLRNFPRALRRRRWPGIRSREVAAFTRGLATLVAAGLPLDTALAQLRDGTASPPLRAVLATVLQRVKAGTPLSDALAAEPSVFAPLYVNSVRAGEAGGDLDRVMVRLADYLEDLAELKASVRNALTYPALLVVVATVTVIVLMVWVVPRFGALFTEAGQPLPLLTELVFGIAAALRTYGWIAGLLGASLLYLAAHRLRIPDHRRRWDARLLRFPYLGETLRAFETARFARTLGTLLVSGVPLVPALRLARGVLGNEAIAAEIDQATERLSHGARLTHVLRAGRELPALAVQLIEVGEGSGTLDASLLRVAEVYEKEARVRVQQFLIVLEPVLILGVGAVIGLIIVAILSAVLSLNELVI